MSNIKNHPLYNTWATMKKRCYNPNHISYKNYGGRGITVDARWLGSDGFVNFVDAMGAKPEGYTLDRKDNDKGYSPENCKWSSRKEQLLNRRMRSDNTSGVEGVRWVKRDKYWLARIKVDGKEQYLGGFPTKEQAIEARKQALLKLTLALHEAGELKGNSL